MLGIGFPELILILIIGLVIFGPGKLPEIGRAVGKGLQEFKKASSDFSNSLNETPSNGSITPTPPNPANPNQPAVPPVFMQENTTKTAENKLNEQLTKIGLEEGKFAFTFNADSTFTIRLKDKDLHGSYSYDSSNKRINLKLLKLVGLNAKVNCTSTNLELLFNFDKLLDLITLLTSKGSNTLQTINSLAESYDGMMMGFAFCKEGQ